MGDSVGVVIQILTAAAAVAACVLQVGKVIRTIEVIGDKVDKLTDSLSELASRSAEHGERIARVEGRAEAGRRA